MQKEIISSVIRAMEIIECFADSNRKLTLKEIKAIVELPSTTVHRQLTNLVESDFLMFNNESKLYSLGPRLLRLSSSIVGKNSLRATARPEMEKLAEKTRETINLCQLLGNNVFYLDKISVSHTIGYQSPVGTIIPAHMTAVGKAMLSYKEDKFIEELDEFIQATPPATKRTVLSAKELITHLHKVKSEGYAADLEEYDEGLICVAAPIFDMDGQAIAAISIAGPAFRMSASFEDMVLSVKEAGSRISLLLGHKSN